MGLASPFEFHFIHYRTRHPRLLVIALLLLLFGASATLRHVAYQHTGALFSSAVAAIGKAPPRTGDGLPGRHHSGS